MTKEQYFGLKNELKELASKIKSAKLGFKKAQRDFSIFQRDKGSRNAYFNGTIKSTQWETIKPEYDKLDKSQLNLMNDLHDMQSEYRHKHIIYCFARGKSLNQIEPKVREGNEADWYKLEKLMGKYDVKEPVVLSV